MAKTQKPKHDLTANPRSRASKRQTSPSLNIDKTLRNAPRATDATPFLPPLFHSAKGSNGIVKPSRKHSKKNMSRAQRARQEKVLARAEAVQDQMEKKVDGSRDRLRKRKARKSAWDEVNGVGKDERRRAVLGVEDMDVNIDVDADIGPTDGNEWEDIAEMDDDPGKDVIVEDAMGDEKGVTAARAVRNSAIPAVTEAISTVTLKSMSTSRQVDDEAYNIT